MKRTAFFLFSVICAVMFAVAGVAAEKYKSLRGDAGIPGKSTVPAPMDWKPEESAIARTFEHQPPLVPHTVQEYDITTSDNDCLDCHGDPDSGAPLPHSSHFVDREGKATESVSSQWYFCTQCHVGQVDVKPLVENTFQAK